MSAFVSEPCVECVELFGEYLGGFLGAACFANADAASVDAGYGLVDMFEAVMIATLVLVVDSARLQCHGLAFRCCACRTLSRSAGLVMIHAAGAGLDVAWKDDDHP